MSLEHAIKMEHAKRGKRREIVLPRANSTFPSSAATRSRLCRRMHVRTLLLRLLDREKKKRDPNQESV